MICLAAAVAAAYAAVAVWVGWKMRSAWRGVMWPLVVLAMTLWRK